MIRAVLDTNVVMSAIFFGGLPAQIMEAWYSGAFEMVITEDIYQEYRRVYNELAVRYREIAVPELMNMISSTAIVVQPLILHEQICADQEDDKFIACALARKAIIISGDKKLLATSGYRSLTILTPRRFVEAYM